jgi:hypothetical protein
VGTWTLVSITLEKDGKENDLYGPNPQGQATYDANGCLSVIVTRSDLPKFASNNREAGTPEENKAIVQGSLAYFGYGGYPRCWLLCRNSYSTLSRIESRAESIRICASRSSFQYHRIVLKSHQASATLKAGST